MLGDAPSGASGLLTRMEAPALPSNQKGPTAHTVPPIVLLPVLGKALRGWRAEKKGS